MSGISREKIEIAFMNAVRRLRFYAPYDTGNLSQNAIRFAWENEKTFIIYVDESIAPYMPYTNEPWISPKWGGKKNPNEKWWQETVQIIAEEMAAELKGVLTVG